MKILLVCAAGMSTSILVDKLLKVAEEKGIDLDVKAVANSSIQEEIGKWDVCLLGPQVQFAKQSIATIINIPTEVIDLQAYAFADAEKVFQQAEALKLKAGK